MRTKLTLVAAIALVTLTGLASPIGSAASHGDVVEIELVETGQDDAPYAFEPGEVTVEPGTTVRWVHTHDVFHTITSTDSLDEKQANGMFDGSLGSEGDTFEYTFEEAGTFHFYCQPHSGFMFGTVIVEDGTTSDAPMPGALALVAVLGAVAFAAARRR